MRAESLKWLVVVAAGHLVACEAAPPVPAQATAPDCVAPGETCRIIVDDGSYLKWAGPVTDGVQGGVSSAVVTYVPGRLCMAGTVDAGPAGGGWGAILLAGLFTSNPSTEVAATLDAPARGIEQVRFEVENPPLTGLLPQMAQLGSADCRQVPECLRTFSATTTIDEPETVTLPLPSFNRPDGDHPNTTLDPALIAILQFYVAPLPGLKVPYDFCISRLSFLDGAGREVAP